MSWHCSQEPEAVFSVHDYLAGIRSERSRSNPILGTSSCNDSGTGCLMGSPCGMMSEPSMENRGEVSWMSSAEASHAKTSHRLVKELDLPASVLAFGSSISESLMKSGLVSSSQKTARTCVPVASAPLSKDLPRWGMVSDGVCWGLGMSLLPTSETECGFWPTPTADQPGIRVERLVDRNGNTPTHPNQRWYDRHTGRVAQKGLAQCVQLWPTPTAADRNGPRVTPRTDRNPTKHSDLRSAVRAQSPNGGPLNPNWVEWLMGWPIGWTESKPLAMDKFRLWLQQHGIS